MKQCNPYVKTFSISVSVQLNILCASAVKLQYANSNSSPKAENFQLNSSDLSLVDFSLWRALQQKLHRQKIEGIHLFCYIVGSATSKYKNVAPD